MASVQSRWLFLLLVLSITPSVLSKNRPISDSEIRQKKNDCYADIESGLWGQQCRSSMAAKENCALRCASPTCYELIYESDPIEEGEKDITRNQEYRYCLYKSEMSIKRYFNEFSRDLSKQFLERLSLGEPLEGIKGAFKG